MTIIVSMAISVVAFVLILGLINMLRDGPADRSQRLMRWRVGLQALAVLIICVAIYMSPH